MIFVGFVTMYIRIAIFCGVTLYDLVFRYQRSKITVSIFRLEKNNLFHHEDADNKVSETSVSVCQTRQRNIPEELNHKYSFNRNCGKNDNEL